VKNVSWITLLNALSRSVLTIELLPCFYSTYRDDWIMPKDPGLDHSGATESAGHDSY